MILESESPTNVKQLWNSFILLNGNLLIFWFLYTEENKDSVNYLDEILSLAPSLVTMPIPLVVSTSTPIVPIIAAKSLTTLGVVIEKMLSHYFKSPMVNSLAIGDNAPFLTHKAFVTKYLS